MPTETVKKKRMLATELQAMARISRIMDELDPMLHGCVVDWLNNRYDKIATSQSGIVRTEEHPNGLFQ